MLISFICCKGREDAESGANICVSQWSYSNKHSPVYTYTMRRWRNSGDFRGFPQYLQVKAKVVSRTWHESFLLHPHQTHRSYITSVPHSQEPG
jgi:hypothetical protein